MTLRNLAPANGLPRYIGGNIVDPDQVPGTSLLYVSVYSPWEARSASVGDEKLLFEADHEFGRRVYSFYVNIPPGDSIVVHFDLAGQYDPRGRYSLNVLRQPTVTPDDLTTSVSVAPGWSLLDRSQERTTVTEHRPLDEDLAMTLKVRNQ